MVRTNDTTAGYVYITNGDYSSDTEKTNQNSEVESSQSVSIFSSDAWETFKKDMIDAIVEGITDEYLFDCVFRKDEAEIYVQGEQEIAQMVEEKKKNAGFLDLLLDFGSMETECRKEYAEKHPEYKKVMNEGQRVERQYEDDLYDAKKNWMEENPEPQAYEKGGLFGIKETDAHKEWSEKEAEFKTNFEEEYIKNNPDYATLKDAQNALE